MRTQSEASLTPADLLHNFQKPRLRNPKEKGHEDPHTGCTSRYTGASITSLSRSISPYTERVRVGMEKHVSIKKDRIKPVHRDQGRNVGFEGVRKCKKVRRREALQQVCDLIQRQKRGLKRERQRPVWGLAN